MPNSEDASCRHAPGVDPSLHLRAGDSQHATPGEGCVSQPKFGDNPRGSVTTRQEHSDGRRSQPSSQDGSPILGRGGGSRKPCPVLENALLHKEPQACSSRVSHHAINLTSHLIRQDNRTTTSSQHFHSRHPLNQTSGHPVNQTSHLIKPSSQITSADKPFSRLSGKTLLGQLLAARATNMT